MSELPGLGPEPDDLDDPAALWPGQEGEPDPEPPPEPQKWVWAAMEPPERRARIRELATWIEWLLTAHEMKSTIPACWYRHPKVLEHLTALYTGWVRTYCHPDDSERDLAEAEWLSTLHSMEPYLKVPACATRHVPPPAPPQDKEDRDREERTRALEYFLITSPFGTGPAQHPVPDEPQGLAPSEPPL